MIMRYKIFLLLILTALAYNQTYAQNDSLIFYYNKAKEAQAANDTTVFYNMIMKAYKIHPYHPTIQYMAGIANVLNKKNQQAMPYLRKAVNANAEFDLERSEFNPIRSSSDFQALLKTKQNLLQPIVQSDTAFLIRDRTLHLESIAKGLEPNTFFCGSIHKRKIIEVDNNGKISDFTTPGQDGLTSVFGIRVNEKTKTLWACASPMPEMENFDSTARSAVFQYDIKSKKLIAKYFPPDNMENVFGDLTLDPTGNVYVSDSRNNIIFKVNATNKKLEEFFTSPDILNLQGIAFSTDGKNLFIADYIGGLFHLNMQSKKLARMKVSFDLSTKSVDGLSFYNNSLIAIQNSIYPMRVTQYFLNAAQDELIGYKVIDAAHPAFNEPTIGFVDGNNFFYVANSLWSGYVNRKNLKPDDQLQDVVILKADLKKIK
jgi:sugar lactone lactonase YvrE